MKGLNRRSELDKRVGLDSKSTHEENRINPELPITATWCYIMAQTVPRTLIGALPYRLTMHHYNWLEWVYM